MPDCPTCSDSFDSEHGVKVHHKQIHDESLANSVVCDWCGDEFHRKPSEVERYDNNFCEQECKDAFHADYMTGRERPEHAEKMSELHSGEGNPMYGVRGEDAPAWQGGEQMAQNWRRSAEWFEARRTAVERDGGECQVCGTEENLHVHHIHPVSEGGEKFDTENLITLCSQHHYMKHSNGEDE
jgi:hypothetical protein